jgi:cytochrome b subunit of formate dehydrogenase
VKAGKVQRFTAFQIVLHWGQAVWYLTLVLTGGVILLQRLFRAEWLPHAALSLVHRGTAVLLTAFLVQMVLALLLTGHFKAVRQDLLECLLIRPRDLFWLIKAPINAFRPHVKLPPAGRFNAGQKLHGAFVFLAVPTFIASGTWMMIQPSALAPWFAHAELFVLACAFLTLHVFLATINPSTRRALGGIFTGYVSREYAEAHHPLWVGREHPRPHGAILSWKAAAACLLVLVAAAGAGAWWYGPQRLAGRISRWTRQHGADAVLPGDLCAAHASLAEAGECFRCHQAFAPPPSDKCLSCHEEIARVQQGQVGYHGRLQGKCRSCHRDHAGSEADTRWLQPAAFNHQQARFCLHGKHQQVACEKCHRKTGIAGRPETRHIGLAFDSCRSCHANPHATARSDDCTRCHTEHGWGERELTFDHARGSEFRLEGKHEGLACRACHDPRNRLSLTAGGAADVPAVASLRAIRPMPATAISVPSVPPPGPSREFVLIGVGSRCADCHVDPHRPSLGEDCRRCHGEQGWTGREVNFAHDRDTKYPLEGRHAAAQCTQCHKLPSPGVPLAVAPLRGIATSCAACHADVHQGSLGPSCTRCHTEKGWTGRELLFQHSRDSTYRLEGRHADVRCEKCHRPPPGCKPGEARFAGTSASCRDCHQDPHRGSLKGECSTCHNLQGWKGKDLLFVHDRDSQFKIDAIRSGLSCSACHKDKDVATRYRPLPTTCYKCHADVTGAMQGKAAGISGPVGADPHSGRVECSQCHSPQVRSPAPALWAQGCASCHKETYAGLYLSWRQSLDERATRAQKILDDLRRGDLLKAEELAGRIRLAKVAGLHNPQLARKLWDEIINTHTELSR